MGGVGEEETAARALQPLTVGASSGSGGDDVGAGGPEAAEERPPAGGDGEGARAPEAVEEEPAASLGGEGVAAEEDAHFLGMGLQTAAHAVGDKRRPCSL